MQRCVMSFTVFHQPTLPTGAARCSFSIFICSFSMFIFCSISQISPEMRLLIVANWSLLLQLSLDFFVSGDFIRGLNRLEGQALVELR